MKRRSIGIVGGLCPLATADIYFKAMMQVKANQGDADYPDIIINAALEQEVRGDIFDSTPERRYDLLHRSLYIYQAARELKNKGVDTILVPDFLSYSFARTISENINAPLVDIVDVLAQAVKSRWPQAVRVGLLTATLSIEKKVFEEKFSRLNLEIIYPDKNEQEKMVMEAVYGKDGIKKGNIHGRPCDLIFAACSHVLKKGADVIVTGITELPLIDRSFYPAGKYLDCNEAIACALVKKQEPVCAQPEKRKIIGILGGLGPAATVDIFDKIVKNTPAAKDQEHIKIIIENNPQIPDRTAALNNAGEDPGVALLASARKLEDAGADFIIVPCNTAHVFLEAVKDHITIPVVSMIDKTAEYIAASFSKKAQADQPGKIMAGLLATTGTIRSGVYEKTLKHYGIEVVTPSDNTQEKMVMEGIYGKNVVKAGGKTPEAKDLLLKAAQELAESGAQVIILGCTEIPLVLKDGDLAVPFVDPTGILAKAAVKRALGRN